MGRRPSADAFWAAVKHLARFEAPLRGMRIPRHLFAASSHDLLATLHLTCSRSTRPVPRQSISQLVSWNSLRLRAV